MLNQSVSYLSSWCYAAHLWLPRKVFQNLYRKRKYKQYKGPRTKLLPVDKIHYEFTTGGHR